MLKDISAVSLNLHKSVAMNPLDAERVPDCDPAADAGQQEASGEESLERFTSLKEQMVCTHCRCLENIITLMMSHCVSAVNST